MSYYILNGLSVYLFIYFVIYTDITLGPQNKYRDSDIICEENNND